VEELARSLGDVVGEIWRRAVSVQPLPSAGSIVAIGLLGVVLVVAQPLWPVTRLLVTVAHEGGHAVAAVLTGRRLQGIRVHRDTSGLTLSRGRPRGAGMVATLLGGYLGPAVAGVGAAALLATGRSLGVLWLLVAVGVWLLLQVRNAYGFAVLLLGGAGIAAISWWLPPAAQSSLAYLITWVLLVAAPKPVFELARQRRAGAARDSDVDQLATLTRVPGVVWMTVLLLLSATALLAGFVLLLPDLATQLAATFG
jgi:hypothetical protein